MNSMMDKSFNEYWKDVWGYNGKYQVSNTGKVRSTNYNNTGKTRELKIKVNRYGFCEVKLSKNNVAKDYMVARLVAEAFLPNPMQKPEVMHKSSDKLDNSIYNLQWAYKSETRHNMYNKGSRKNAKPSYKKITYKDKSYDKYSQIAKDLGINSHTFWNRIKRSEWGLYEALEVPVAKATKER